jgi:multidrug resistance efflux pump
MKPRIRWGMILPLSGLAALGTVLVKNVSAGPANVARPSEVKQAAREIASPPGQDDRMPLGQGGYVSGNAIIEPADRETKVAGEAAGRIRSIWAREGETVESGTVLVELENGTEKAALDAAMADVAMATAALGRTARGLRKEDIDAIVEEADAAKARAQLSGENFGRTERLAAQGAVTPAELDSARRQAEADDRTFKAADARRLGAVRGGRPEDVAVAQAQLQGALAHRDEARAALERLSIRAPIVGTILQVKYRVGEYYNPGSANPNAGDPVVVLGDTRTLRARVDIDERDVARVRMGAAGYVTLSALPGQRIRGKVVDVARRMGRKNVRTDDPVERLDVKILEVVLELEKPAGLVPGIRVTAYVESAPM